MYIYFCSIFSQYRINGGRKKLYLIVRMCRAFRMKIKVVIYIYLIYKIYIYLFVISTHVKRNLMDGKIKVCANILHGRTFPP